MPTYKNQNNIYVEVKGTKIPPNEEYSSISYLDEKSGLTKIDDFPMFNPIIISCYVDKPYEIQIPNIVNRFAIHFYVEYGYPVIIFNSKRNKPYLKLYPTAKWDIRCYERIIDKVLFEFENYGKVWMIVEKI